jgi:hypothetical protein
MKNTAFVLALCFLSIAVYGQTVPVFSVDPSFFEIQESPGGLVISGYTGQARGIRIPAEINGRKVIAIGGEAFNDRGMEALVLPEGITEIGDEAFAFNSLGALLIPSTVTKIGAEAFAYNRIAELILPPGLVSLGPGAFSGNIISRLVLPPSLRLIEDSAFSRNRIRQLEIPRGIIEIGDDAFSNNPVETLTLPRGLIKIGGRAFSGSTLDGGTAHKLRDLILPEGLEAIGRFAFAGTTQGFSSTRNNDGTIIRLSLPSSLKVIESGAFAGNPVEELVIGAGVDVSERAFEDGFTRYYESNGRKAGRYVLRNGAWSGDF